MKLFLSSVAITKELLPSFEKLVGKKAGSIRFALIENAADVYDEADRGFVKRESDALEEAGLKLSIVDLRNHFGKPGLQKVLSDFDVIWLGGGNTYYLRWALRESGFDKIIRGLLEEGIVYAGGSAGAIVAGPTIKNFEDADEPQKAPKLIENGLGLTDFVPLPHWSNEKFGHIIAHVKQKFDKTSVKVLPITDKQAIIVNGNRVTIAP